MHSLNLYQKDDLKLDLANGIEYAFFVFVQALQKNVQSYSLCCAISCL